MFYRSDGASEQIPDLANLWQTYFQGKPHCESQEGLI